VQPTPKSIILDVLSSARGRDVPVRALLAAGALFGVSAETLRVALARLLRQGTIARGQRGQYRLAGVAQPVQRHVTAWTRLGERMVPWRGGWVMVHTGHLERSDRRQLRRRERALHFLGLRELVRGVWLRPDNLAGGVTAVRAELHALGLDAAALVGGLSDLDAGTTARAQRLWDGAGLRRQYRDAGAALQRSAARLPRLDPPAAMTESFLLGGNAIRLLAFDPLLPEPIVDTAERDALVEALRQYDKLGRACWRPLMQSHGAPRLDTPRAPVEMEWPRRAAAGGRR
jgi:phenylacetic acid degradation operon negative regulatory protein